MGRFAGLVTIVAADGTVMQGIEASLVGAEPTDRAEERWFGTIKGDFDAFDLMEGTPTLQFPDGASAPFRLNRTDLVLPRKGIEIVGTGEPPF